MSSHRPMRDTVRLQQINLLLHAALALPPLERDEWLQRLPPEHAAMVPLLRTLLRRAQADSDAFMRRPAASIG